MITEYFEITDKNEFVEPNWWKNNIGDNFNGVKKIVGFKWVYNNKSYIKKFKYGVSPEVLPNKDGFIVCEKNNPEDIHTNELVVYESNGSERFRIKTPVVTEFSNAENAFFYYAKYLKKSDEWECYFDESGTGHEYKAKLKIHTGELSAFKQVRI